MILGVSIQYIVFRSCTQVSSPMTILLKYSLFSLSVEVSVGTFFGTQSGRILWNPKLPWIIWKAELANLEIACFVYIVYGFLTGFPVSISSFMHLPVGGRYLTLVFELLQHLLDTRNFFLYIGPLYHIESTIRHQWQFCPKWLIITLEIRLIIQIMRHPFPNFDTLSHLSQRCNLPEI